jgi:hypothetical protein
MAVHRVAPMMPNEAPAVWFDPETDTVQFGLRRTADLSAERSFLVTALRCLAAG